MTLPQMHSKTIIDQTPDYKLEICENPVNIEGRCYSLTNRVHGIVELETCILPLALKYMRDLQAMLDAIKDFNEETDLSGNQPRLQ